MPFLTLGVLVGTAVTKTVKSLFDHFLPTGERIVAAPMLTTELPEWEANVEEAEANPLAAAESEPAAVSQVAAAFNNAARAVNKAVAELTRTCPASIFSGDTAPMEETSAAALCKLSEAADALYNSSVELHQAGDDAAVFDTAVAALNATALEDDSSASAVLNVAVDVYSAADALHKVTLALDWTSATAVRTFAATWHNASLAIYKAAAALHEASRAKILFGVVQPDVNSAAALSPVATTV
ncbi:uncharacterized protein [Paralichthys olivaceus]|uniref:uncharacterized protein n=1 Tax=Paralichthys olivaceus TaxID=8255 RepID=UPI003751FC58